MPTALFNDRGGGQVRLSRASFLINLCGLQDDITTTTTITKEH
jgi:hypothetical protein